MVNANVDTLCHTTTAPVNVLFVDCRTAFVDKLVPRLIAGKLSWGQVSFSQLQDCLESRTIIGSVVFGPSVVDAAGMDVLSRLIKSLQKQHTAIYFLKKGPPLTPENPLLTVLADPTESELAVRLETAALFARQRRIEQRGQVLHDDLAEQLELAGQVQRNFLPARLPHTAGVHWSTMFRPAQWVSGDIYDVSRLDEKHIGFYLADAVGHSMPAALLTIFLKQATIMRQTFDRDYRIYEPSEVVAELNRRMAHQGFSGCLFATCCYGLLNTETFELRLARAGHPYPLLIRDNKPACLQSRGGLLGVFDQAQFEQVSVTLEPGDKLLLYSDGGEPLIGDAADNGAITFSKAFEAICDLPLEQMVQAYDHMARCHRFKPGELDDVTAIGLEILP